MAGETITMIWEELQDEILIRQHRTPDDAVINGKRASFCPSHVCDGEGCDFVLELKETGIGLSKLVHLNLSNCSLKSIPDCLSELPLKSLNLSHNSLHFVPKCIHKGLDLLENLNLSYNKIKEFETAPKCILNLKILDLTRNSMQYIPIWFVHVKCMNLIELYYSGNILGKTNDSLYCKVIYPYSIKKMILQNSCMLNDNIVFIKSIRTLQILDISNDDSVAYYNSFTDYEDLFDAPDWRNSIEILNVSCLGMGFLSDNVCSLIFLKELYLSKNLICWLPDVIGNLCNLEILDVSKNSVCFLPNTIVNLKKLRVLNLQFNKLSDIKMLDNINLEILDLYENELDWFDLDVNKYKYLDLERNCFDTIYLACSYADKRLNYRQALRLNDRRVGCQESAEIKSEISESESKINYGEIESDHRNVTPDSSYEEECWDDEKKASHPDVTPSDDEWLGYIPIQKPIVKKPEESLEYLLENLYTDVD